jgi:branched-chain amino acid aminotransferase
MKGTLPYVYFQGKIVPAETAKISIASHSLQYGMTAFGGFRGYYREGKARLFRLADHYERLMNAARILGINY